MEPYAVGQKKLETTKVIEAALFMGGRYLSLEELSDYADNAPISKVKKSLDEIKADYIRRDSPIELVEEEGKFKLDVRKDYLDRVKHLAPQMDMRKAVLTTLSYVAFKQPITQAKLVKLFGNRIYEYVKELVQRGLINAPRYKRTRRLTTSKKLASYLGARDLEQIRRIQVEKIGQTLKAEIAKEEAEEQKKKVDELKELEKKKELSMDEWERLLEIRRVKEQKRAERRAKRKKEN